MTDVVDTGPAPAAPEATAVPINEAPVTPPNPIESNGPEKAPEPVETKPSSSVKEAIAKAEAKLKEAPKAEAKPEPKAKAEPAKEEPKAEPRPRDETGKFASKQPAQAAEKPQESPEAKPVPEQPKTETRFREAPKRFSDDAKQAWETAPEPVKAEIHRAVKELEEGIGKYREAFEPLKPYVQLAQQHNTTIDKALGQYITFERALRSSDPAQRDAALHDVFHTAGVNPREWAAQLLNQTPDQITSQQDATIRELRQQISRLEQQVGGVTQTVQQQREAATLQEVTQFAEAHPRFEELANDIAFFMQSGRASTLSEAYELAERLNPAPAPAPAPVPIIPAPTPVAHTDKGTKSISGTPSHGSSPAKQAPSKSIRDALKSAMARAS